MSYRPDIDGLRAISVLLVILFHFGSGFVPGGFIGVDVFFVISGYLITGLLLEQSRDGIRSLLWFYDRRVRRIMPALLLVIAVCVVAGEFVLVQPEISALRESAFYSVASLANFYFLSNTGYFDSAAERLPLLHIWSLGVEEQFYIVWPLLLFLAIKATRDNRQILFTLTCVLIVASFVASVRTVSSDPKLAFFLPHTRAWELGIGAALAILGGVNINLRWMREALPLIGLALIVATGLTLTENDPFPGWGALAPCAGAALVVLPLGRTWAASVLSIEPMKFLGKISYSLYLWHWPVLVFFRIATGAEFPSVIESAVLLAVSILISWASWKFVETPVRHWQPLPSQKKALVSAFAVVTACGISIWAYEAVKNRNWTAERLIVREQLNRARRVSSPDIAFFGDSSCLTGIHPPTVAKILQKSVESFCMFGSAGPIADSRTIGLLAERKALPRTAIVVIHPVQLRRIATSPEWVSFIENAASRAQPGDVPPIRLRGAFSARYHRAADLVSEIRNVGSLIDPSPGITIKNKLEITLPRAFENYMTPLSKALTVFDAKNVYLLTPPLPEGADSGGMDEAVRHIAKVLGISETNILQTRRYMPVPRYAAITHLNEQGRDEFSRELAGIIKKQVFGQ